MALRGDEDGVRLYGEVRAPWSTLVLASCESWREEGDVCVGAGSGGEDPN